MRALEQGTALFTAACIFIAILVGIQLWLLSAAMDAMLCGEYRVLSPAAIASALLALASGGILLYAMNVDHKIRAGRRRG